MDNKDIREIVSSTTAKTHVRHLARLNRCMTFDNLHTTVAATRCGRWIHWPNDITGVKDTYADGTPYTTQCPICYKDAK